MFRRRLCTTFALSLLACTAFTQDHGKQVEYTTVAIPLRKAVNDLSKQWGASLLVSEELAKEPIVLRLHGVPTQEALDRIADVMSAEWVKTDKGLELRRTDRIVEALQKSRAHNNLENITKELKRLETAADEPALDESTAKQIATTYAKILADEQSNSETGDPMAMRGPLDNRTADMRLLAKMLIALGPPRIASLPVGLHTFTFEPNHFQEPIERLDSILPALYVSERNILSKALDEALPKTETGFNFATPIDRARTSAEGPVRPLLDIEVLPRDMGITASLNVYDKSGSQISSVSANFSGFDQATFNSSRVKAILDGKGQPGIPVTETTAEFAKRMVHTPSPPGPLTPISLEVLCHPEAHDPLSFVYSEGLIGVATARNENLVATTLDEGGGGLYRSIRKGLLDSALFMSALSMSTRNDVREQEGWLLCKPANPIDATLLRTDREMLGRFIRAVNEKGFATIEDWAEMAQGVPYPSLGYVVLNDLTIWRGDPFVPSYNDWETLRLYGSLSQEQAANLRHDGSLDFASLSENQRQILSRMLFSTSHPSISKPTPPGAADSQGTPTEGMYGLLSEPTEAAPNGIPDHAAVSMREDAADQFYVNYSNAYSVRDSPCDIQTLAFTLAQADQMTTPQGEELAKVDTVKYGGQRVISFSLMLSDDLAMKPTLTERRTAGSAIPVDKLADNLPSEVWARLKKLVDEDRAKMQKYRGVSPSPQPQAPAPPPQKL